MKVFKLVLTLSLAALFLGCNKLVDKSQTVNPVLGDISFEAKFGYKPDHTTDEFLRIKTHLEYVENLLRSKDISGLSTALRTKRKNLLRLLHEYTLKGDFPKNYDYKDERKPCFIDKNGSICAVGYLIEKTTSREVANNISLKHKYDELLSMNDGKIDDWVSTSGLTKEECAMIQPTYGPIPTPTETYNHISPAYGISSAIVSGINLSLNTVNGIQIGRRATKNIVPLIGLATGAGQIVLGSAMFPKEQSTINGTTTNESQKTLSLINIGLGTTTMILSTWNLVTNRKCKEKLTMWNIGLPVQDKNNGMSFSLTHKF